ncbi:MAG: SpaA isopeptide-forming pilin-related protein [Tissierellia bacterium]|nr:SpaA isopeptide-forming pilin-related protein [Tissierellia bacterium]
MKKLKNIFTSLMVLILTLGVINEVKAQTKQGDFRYEQIFFEGNGGTMYHVRKDGLSTEEGYENYGYLLMDEEPVFCIDASTPYESGSTFTGREFRDGEVISEGTGFKITKDVQKKLERIAYYGYQSQKSDKNYVYTQMLIWENIDRVARRFTYPLSIEEYRQFKNDVMSKVNNHSFTPSWHNKTYTLKKGQSITLTNTNTSIGELNIPKYKNGYNFKVNGNKLTITATNNAVKNSKIIFLAKTTDYEGTSFIWKKPGEQNMGSFKMPDPFIGRLTLNIQESSPLEITKVDELGRAVSGVKFKVWYSDEENSKTYTTGKDGKVKIDNRLVGKTIKIQEISAPNHLELSKEIKSIEIKANILNKVKFINKIKSSTLNLKKVDEDGRAVPGVKFKVWYTNDISSAKTYTTDSKGLVNIKGLKANREISVQEISVPNHLVLDKTIKKITIKPAGVGTLTFTNKIKRLDWSAIKVDENDKPIKGAKFEATVKKDNQKYRYISDEKGEFKQTGWKAGTRVTVREIEAPKGYELDPTPQTFILKPGVNIKIKFVNKFKPATLNLKKLDEDGNAVPGVKFKVWYTNDISSAKTYTTDSKGLVNIKGLKANREISVQEIEVPNHLVLDETIKRITIKPDEVGTLTFTNKIKRLDWSAIKVDEKDKPIKGAKFEATVEKDNQKYTYISDEKGEFKQTGWKAGTRVTVREIEAPKGYELDPTPQTFILKPGVQIKLKFVNKKILSKIEIAKVDELGKPVANVKFKVWYSDDKESEKTIVTNEKGIATVTNFEVGREISIQEISVPNHLVLREEIKTLILEPEKTGKVEFKNLIKKGNIEILKVSSHDKKIKLAGVEFDLLKDGKTIQTKKTGKDGIAVFENVHFGKYQIREKETIPGYFKNTTVKDVEIKENKEVIKLVYENEKKPEIKTLAKVNGEKEIFKTGMVSVTDEVIYKDLVPGKEYIVKGVLMDKSTNKPLLIEGREIREEKIFIPDVKDGMVKLEFKFDVSKCETNEIVVFERLYKDGKEIAVHADIDDIGQTVKFKEKPKTPNTGDNSQIIKTGVVLSLSFIGMVLVRLFGRKNSYL